MQTIYGVTSGENIVQAFTEENTTEANFHQSINNAAILTFTTTDPLKDGVRFFLTKDPINDYKNEEFMYFEITDQDFDGYEYTYRAEEYAYHDLDTMGYVKKIYNQGNWTTKSLLESITYNDVEPKGIARTKWEIIDNGITLPTTWAGEGNTYTLWYNTPLRGIEKFIEYFGGEIRFYVTIVDNKISRHYLELYLQRGRQTGKRYESNSNLISLTNKAEYGDRYEYIIPLAEGGGADGDEQKYNTPNGFNNYITLEGLEVGKSTDKWYKPKSQLYVSLANDKNAYPLKTQPKGLQNNPRIKPVTFDEVKSKEALFDKAIEWLENNQGVAWSYSASVLDIGESQVGDTIAIIDERSGISSYVRVHDIDYDMIDPENTGVHFGSNWGYENDEAITDMVNTVTSVKNDLTGLLDTAIRQSNGKNTNYYGENEPANPIEGDLWYWQKGDESGIKIYHDGDWIDLVDSNTLTHINEQVDKALADAKTYSDNLSAKNKEYSDSLNKTLSDSFNGLTDDLDKSINDLQFKVDNNIGEIKKSIIDTNDSVSELDQTVNGFQARVETIEGDVSTFNQTVEGFRGQVEGYKGEVATFNQTAKGFQARIESAEGNISTLTNTVDGFQAELTDQNDSLVKLAMGMGGISAEIKNKTDQSTVLQLFNDNFALGIKDNTKNIITGINGDKSGFIISGKKIVVNGDTIFDGNNFMNAAIIKDGSIGTAKIGDLAVTSAKIKDLNVDKLTGNVSNFIQSNWTGKYESVTINSTGMLISVPEEQSVTKYSGDGMQIARWNGSTAYMAATEWKDSTDEGLQIGIGDDSEFFALGYQNRKDKVYYGKLIWGSPKAKMAPKGFTFDDSSQFNDAITVTTKQGSDGLTLFGNNFVQLFGDIKTTGNITLSGDLEFTTYGTIKIGEAGQNLFVGKQSFKNFDYPSIGNASSRFAGFAYGSSQTYLVSDGTYYNVTKVIKALDSIGTLQIPTRMNSDGTAATWKTVTI